jgi:hypothetical protein
LGFSCLCSFGVCSTSASVWLIYGAVWGRRSCGYSCCCFIIYSTIADASSYIFISWRYWAWHRS